MVIYFIYGKIFYLWQYILFVAIYFIYGNIFYLWQYILFMATFYSWQYILFMAIYFIYGNILYLWQYILFRRGIKSLSDVTFCTDCKKMYIISEISISAARSDSVFLFISAVNETRPLTGEVFVYA